MDPEEREKIKRKLSDTGDNIAIPVQLGSKAIANIRHKKYRALAEKHRQKGKLAQAERCYNKALYISMNLMESDNFAIAVDLESLATILWEQGKSETAQALMARAKRIKDSI